MLSKPAIRLLRKVQKHILEEPRRMNMETWLRTRIQGKRYFAFRGFGVNRAENPATPPCGTAGCIAGWVMMLTPMKPEERSYIINVGNAAHSAQEKLGLDYYQGSRLFLPSDWPEPYKSKLAKAKIGTKKYAQVVSDRIDYFIQTDGKDGVVDSEPTPF